MNRRLVHVSLLVPDYDDAIQYYTGVLGFILVEDTPLSPEKRWVLIQPGSKEGGCMLLLAKAATPEQKAAIGNQTGGRVFLFLHTDDFDRDYNSYKAKGVEFTGDPRSEAHGKVVVFKDKYGNLWDLIQPSVH